MDETLRHELRRKAFHLLGLLFLGAYLWLGPATVLKAMWAWTAAAAAFETARLKSPACRRLVEGLFGPLLRSKEAARFSGAFYTSLGVLAVFQLYGARPKVVAASICYLALGDAASAVVGRAFGGPLYRVRGEIRSYSGSAAGLAAAVLIGLVLGLGPWGTAAGAAAFMLTDTVPIWPDDNLWIPLVCGAALLGAGVRG